MWRVAALVAAAGMLAACSSGEHAAHSASPSASTTMGFVAAVRHSDAKYGLLSGYSDGDLLFTGHEVCSILAHPHRQAFSTRPIDDLMHEGWDAAPAAEIVLIAKRDLC